MSDSARISLVTGGNRGIGLEVCRQLAQLGDTVLLTARSENKARDAAHAVAVHGTVIPLVLDVNAPSSIEAAQQAIARQFGRLDALINNAAIDYDTDQRVMTANLKRVAGVLDTNTLGPWRVTQSFLPLLKKSSRGRIVNVSSSAGAWGTLSAGTPAYSLSKASLNALTIMMARALRGTGILVNAICPGWVATDMGGAGGGPVQKGAESIVWGVTLPNDGPTGGFFRHGRPIDW